ncbi:glutamyl-tRNA reductase [Methanobrevibacter sp. 87.7]|uniref:glutamyl-tRNA reductase n=1 Tax=Methanobrevibacter sp. 87.7 TaxID=387957 RepID=UPI000B512413|nr:glutamyl-tRNA reductase [Methanobrevibacter sp. 87.7]OWT32473.1 glutamyl-tRNA reductase [Methanobrevibacter sp. 87.7]
MIFNIRVDYKMVDIKTMEIVYGNLKKLFNDIKEKFQISEYVEISTCNRHEFYIHSDSFGIESILNDFNNENIVIEYGEESVFHLFRMSSSLESMIVGEDQILGQIKDSKKKAEKEGHLGKVLNTLFTKAIHVGQEVRSKTNINKGHISMGSAAVDLAEEYLGDLQDKCVLVIGAGKMGALVAKALAEKNLKAIFVANRTYYKATKLAGELNGQAIFFDDLYKYLPISDVIISATGSPHTIITKERIEKATLKVKEDTNKDYTNHKIVIIDIANPRDVSEDVKDIGVNLFNIDDLRGIAEKTTNERKKEVKEAENIINYEFDLLKNSFKIMEIDNILASLRSSMEDIRQREAEKAIVKLADVDGSIKIIDNLTNSIVNKIFFDISKNIKKAACNNDEDLIRAAEIFFLNENNKN